LEGLSCPNPLRKPTAKLMFRLRGQSSLPGTSNSSRFYNDRNIKLRSVDIASRSRHGSVELA
jgi:hypothetical protein